MKNALVTVFGGGGFVGRYVVQALLRGGARVRIAQRHPKQAWFLKAQGDLGQIQFCAADVTRPETLVAAVAGADAVINLVGAFDNVMAVQAEGAANVAEAAARAGVKAFVHMSAIGADGESPSKYGQSKGQGEAAVRAAFPAATILRPSIVFGREDQFLNRFAKMASLMPILPVMRAEAKFQPVFVGDVARAVAASVAELGKHAGKTYALGGPEVINMGDLNRWIAKAIGRDRFVLPLPDEAGAIMARVMGFLPGAPITWDQWLMLQADNVVGDGEEDLAAFGIVPTAMDAVASQWLVQYKKHGRFTDAANAA